MGRSRDSLMDLIEAEDTSRIAETQEVDNMFGGSTSPRSSDGRSIASLRERRQRRPEYRAQLREAVNFVADVYDGMRPLRVLKEALGTADFPYLFGDIIDRQLLSNYRETPQTYREYCKIGSVRDFRAVKRFAMNNAEALLTQVQQQSEYPEVKLTDQFWSYSLKKYGKQIPFDWEDEINDDLDALKDIPARFGRSARRTEEWFATQLFVDANGPLAAFYSTANKNRIHTENGASTNNPPLSIAALQDAILVLMSQVDLDGQPIVIDAVKLVVPPALKVVAENILNGTELWLNLAAAVGTQSLHTTNWMKGKTDLLVNYYIPRVAVTANGGTSWFMFASPDQSRPAIEVGFLRGHEEPEVFMRDPIAQRIGGAAATPMDGDFDTDSIRYKVRHVFGGTTLDWRATVASNGSGV